MTYTALAVDPAPAMRKRLMLAAAETELFGRIIPCQGSVQALGCLNNENIDLLLWGWRPETFHEGKEFFQSLKRREEWIDIPIFAMAIQPDEDRQCLALESGADDCTSYQVSSRKVLANMRLHLQRKLRADEMRRKHNELEKVAVTDPLTGLYNRGFFNAALERETARCQRNSLTFSLLLIDLDHFKSINDSFGHPMGDRVLQAVADSLRGATRNSDTVCRFGGEEFAIILPDTPAAGAVRVAERIRDRISALTAQIGMDGLKVSASIGISSWEESKNISATQLVHEADYALYDSKRQGRNRTILFLPPQAKPYRAFTPGYLSAAACLF